MLPGNRQEADINRRHRIIDFWLSASLAFPEFRVAVASLSARNDGNEVSVTLNNSQLERTG